MLSHPKCRLSRWEGPSAISIIRNIIITTTSSWFAFSTIYYRVVVASGLWQSEVAFTALHFLSLAHLWNCQWPVLRDELGAGTGCAAAVRTAGCALSGRNVGSFRQGRGCDLVLSLCRGHRGVWHWPGDWTLGHSRSQGLSRRTPDYWQTEGIKAQEFLCSGSLSRGTSSSWFCVMHHD